MVLLKSNIKYITACYIIIQHLSLSTLSFSSFVGFDGIALIYIAFLGFLPGTNYAQIMVNRTEQGESLNRIASQVIREGDRIANIVASLLSFSRRENEKPSLISIRELLEESLVLTSSQLKKDGISLSVHIAENLLPISANGQQIEQVFLNIINNSRYALNDRYPHGGDNKKLDIDVSIVSYNDSPIIRTCFTDYGVGIESEV